MSAREIGQLSGQCAILHRIEKRGNVVACFNPHCKLFLSEEISGYIQSTGCLYYKGLPKSSLRARTVRVRQTV